jgi:hypothetical protein
VVVGEQIRAAQDNVSQSINQPSSLQDQLKGQIGTVTRRLDAMDEERKHLLMR